MTPRGKPGHNTGQPHVIFLEIRSHSGRHRHDRGLIARLGATARRIPGGGSRHIWSRPVASAAHVTEAPVVDGALDDRMWQDATPLDRLRAGRAVRRATRLGDARRCEFSTTTRRSTSGSSVTTAIRRRSSRPTRAATPGLGEMDSFQMIFDTFRDQQNGFVFGTNAAGVQYDAQVRDQGDPGVQLGWELGGQDEHRRTRGGRAEFRIPLRTLRYGPAPQTWGVNFFRNIQRTRERTYWAPLPRDLQPGPAVIGGRAARPQSPDAAQFQAAAVRRQLGEPELHAGSRNRPGRRCRLRCEVRGHAQPEPGR